MLKVHILNVGHGDCTIIAHPSGRLTMIDINNSQDYDDESFRELFQEEQRAVASRSRGLGALNPLVGQPFGLGSAYSALSGMGGIAGYAKVQADARRELADPIEFLKRNYPDRRLWRFILTHPDLDHMRGLKALHENIGFHNFWDTANTKPVPNFNSDADRDDWAFYQQLRNGALGLTARNYTRGDSHFAYGKDKSCYAGGDNIEILSPFPDLIRSCNESGRFNNVSLVLRVRHATNSILLPGDIEATAWEHLRNTYGALLKSDFLKASHHGRDTGYDLEALKLIAPRLAFVSVGRLPDTDASSKYRQQCQRVASTRYYGNIELRFHDNGSYEWFVDRNAAAPAPALNALQGLGMFG